MSRRQAAERAQLWGEVAQLKATVQALAAPVAAARVCVHAQPRASLDETGWRAGQPRAWLWTLVTTGLRVAARPS